MVEGLNHLHAAHVVHGNLSGVDISFASFWLLLKIFGSWASILVDSEGHARLADFEFPAVVRGTKFVIQETGHTTALAAPEVLEGAGVITREADILSFAMVVMEVRPRSESGGWIVLLGSEFSPKVFSGRPPFGRLVAPVVISKIVGGKRPDRPPWAQELGLADSVWERQSDVGLKILLSGR